MMITTRGLLFAFGGLFLGSVVYTMARGILLSCMIRFRLVSLLTCFLLLVAAAATGSTQLSPNLPIFHTLFEVFDIFQVGVTKQRVNERHCWPSPSSIPMSGLPCDCKMGWGGFVSIDMSNKHHASLLDDIYHRPQISI